MTLGKVWNKISSRVMVYGGDWNSAQTTVRALTFAKMMDLGRDRIKFYQSDLYHDALWLNEYVNGPTEFEWVARESGTHIGETAKIVKDDDWADSARYRFEIREGDNQKWVLDTYELVVHEGTPVEECEYATTPAGCIYHPAPVAPQMEQGSNDIIDMLFGINTRPLETLNTEPSAPTRKVNKMDDIVRDLREKFNEAESAKEQLEEFKYSIDEAVNDLDTYMSDLDDLINSLDSLPEVSIYVDLDTVSFDS